MSNHIFRTKKKFQNVVCRIIFPAYIALNTSILCTVNDFNETLVSGCPNSFQTFNLLGFIKQQQPALSNIFSWFFFSYKIGLDILWELSSSWGLMSQSTRVQSCWDVVWISRHFTQGEMNVLVSGGVRQPAYKSGSDGLWGQNCLGDNSHEISNLIFSVK